MNKYIFGLLLIIIAHSVIFTKLIYFPYPELFVYPYLTNQGLVPYKQIFDQHFPGLMFLPVNFNNLDMLNEHIARVWSIGLVVLTHVLMFVFFRKIFKDDKKALFANFLYFVWNPFLEGWVFWIEQFLAVFFIPAFYFSFRFLSDKRKNFTFVFLAGLFLGLALVFKQVVLPLIGLLILLIYFFERSPKFIPYFLAGVLPPVFLVLIHFYFKGALWDLWFWTIWFNITTFAAFGRKGPTFFQLVRVIGIFSPAVFLPIIKDTKLKFLSGIFLIGSLSGTFNRFDFVHFQAALPIFCFISSYVFFELIGKFRYRIFFLGYLVMAIVWLTVFYRGHIGNKVFFFEENELKIAQKIREFTIEGEEIYLFGPVAHLYFLSDTLPAGRIFVFQFPWFLMESESRFLEALKNNPPNLVVRDRSVVIEGRPITQFAPDIDKYIEANYEVFDKMGVVEFMRKRDKLQDTKDD